MSEVLFRADVLFGVACAPKGMKRAAVEAAVNAQSPAGTSAGWRIVRRRKLDDGGKHPGQCLDDKGRVHYLMEC